MNTVLFVCTGNYYRSRMAEELFNFWADNVDLEWRADSAGLREDMSKSGNRGPISKHAVSMLKGGGFPIRSGSRMPRSVTEQELGKRDLVICLHRAEHEPMLKKRFPGHGSEILYWDVPDIEYMEAGEAFGIIRKEIEQLVSILSSTRNYLVTVD